MPWTFDDVHAFAMKLPGVSVGLRWNTRTWLVGERGFVWERPLRTSDLERLGDTPPPTGDILAIQTEDLDAKDALLAMDLPGFFTIQHFNGYPAVLVALKKARVKDLRAAIVEAHRAVAAKPPKRPRAKASDKPRSVSAGSSTAAGARAAAARPRPRGRRARTTRRS